VAEQKPKTRAEREAELLAAQVAALKKRMGKK